MYKSITSSQLKKDIGLPDDYNVDGVILTGGANVHSLRKIFTDTVARLYPGAEYEDPIFPEGLFSFIKPIRINNKRIWFDVVYGGAYLSELLHLACLFGSKKNLFFGTCGGLQKHIATNDLIIPTKSYGNESSTRAYWKSDTFEYESDTNLNEKILVQIDYAKVHSGKIMTYQAMLGETVEDIQRWESEGYAGVEMETSTLFSVSKHFKVPSSAILQVADNLAHNQTMFSDDYKLSKEKRLEIRGRNIEILLREMLE